MNTQLANRIKIIPEHDVLTIENGTITLRSGKTWYEFYTESELIFNEKYTDDVYKQELDATIIMDKAEFTKLERRQLIVLLYDTDTNEYIWGNLGNAVKFNSTTHTDRYSLTLFRFSMSAIF
ncbi:hypothetical protein ES705_24093 [subsurface metagenome]